MRSGLPFVALATVACGRFGFEGAPRDGAGSGADGSDGGLSTVDGSTGDCALGALAVPASGLLSGTTDGRADSAAGSCGGAGSPDVIYYLEVPPDISRLRFAGDLSGIEFDSTVYARSACTAPASERACDTSDGAGSNGQLLIDAPEAGPWYLFVDGSGDGLGGGYGASVELLRGAGAACAPGSLNGCMPEHACSEGQCVPVGCEVGAEQTGSFTIASSTGGSVSLHAGTCGVGGDGGQRAPEAIYLLTLVNPVTDVLVTTDTPSTSYDTLIYMRRGCSGPEVACDDDSGANNLTSTFNTGPLAAGDYYLFVDGFSWRSGGYEITVAVTP